MSKITCWTIILLSILFNTAYAYGVQLSSAFDAVATPLMALLHLFRILCWVGGAGLVIGSIFQFKAYWDNPSQVRLSSPITLLVIGLLFIALPFALDYVLALQATYNIPE